MGEFVVKGSRRLIIPLIIALAAVTVLASMLPRRVEATGPASSSKPAAGEAEQTPPLGPAGIGAQEVIDSGDDIQLETPGRLPRIALSPDGSRLAVVYQSGTDIHLKYTDGSGVGWILFPVTIGSGSSPDLVFSPPNTLHVVWLESGNQIVSHVSCTLNYTASPCSSPHTVKAASGETVTAPVIAFTSFGGVNYLYAAWVNFGSPHRVQTTSSTDNGANWTLPPPGSIAAGTLSGGNVTLAAVGDTVHLAYTHDTGNATASNRRIRYHKTTVGSHSWGASIPAAGYGPDSGYSAVSNPDLAATGTAVFLTWDSQKNSPNDNYGLMGISSNNSGTTWLTSTYYITANILFGNGDDPRLTRASGTPNEEAGLRPSVAITGTNDFVVVWQERPDSSCEGGESPSDPPNANSTSEIHYAEAAAPGTNPVPGNWWSAIDGTLANVIDKYSIDPDITVDPTTKQRHIVFMRSQEPSFSDCNGGGLNDYGVFYRGPFTKEQEGVYLPVVIK